MIISTISNGLGNQLFQYAAGRALALRHGTELALDTRSFRNNRLRTFLLDRFKINVAALEDADLPPLRSDNRLKYILWRRLGIGRFRRYGELGMHFNETFFRLGPNTYLSGGWQTERYFADIADIIRAELTVKAPPSAENAAIMEDMARDQSVSLHIRRGDYVAGGAGGVNLGTCTLDYYRSAALRIAETKQIDPVFYVFSDDPNWVSQNLHLPFKTRQVTINHPDTNPEDDIRLMSGCRHHIIANSTFSWWGAWLNGSPDKVVIAPKVWFAEKHLDNRDIVPTSWLRL